MNQKEEAKVPLTTILTVIVHLFGGIVFPIAMVFVVPSFEEMFADMGADCRLGRK